MLDYRESYVGETQRLYEVPQPLVARPLEPLLYRWAAMAICTILLLAWLARLPAPQPVVVLEPAAAPAYTDNRTCIGIAVDCR